MDGFESSDDESSSSSDEDESESESDCGSEDRSSPPASPCPSPTPSTSSKASAESLMGGGQSTTDSPTTLVILDWDDTIYPTSALSAAGFDVSFSSAILPRAVVFPSAALTGRLLNARAAGDGAAGPA